MRHVEYPAETLMTMTMIVMSKKWQYIDFPMDTHDMELKLANSVKLMVQFAAVRGVC